MYDGLNLFFLFLFKKCWGEKKENLSREGPHKDHTGSERDGCRGARWEHCADFWGSQRCSVGALGWFLRLSLIHVDISLALGEAHSSIFSSVSCRPRLAFVTAATDCQISRRLPLPHPVVFMVLLAFTMLDILVPRKNWLRVWLKILNTGWIRGGEKAKVKDVDFRTRQSSWLCHWQATPGFWVIKLNY